MAVGKGGGTGAQLRLTLNPAGALGGESEGPGGGGHGGPGDLKGMPRFAALPRGDGGLPGPGAGQGRGEQGGPVGSPVVLALGTGGGGGAPGLGVPLGLPGGLARLGGIGEGPGGVSGTGLPEGKGAPGLLVVGLPGGLGGVGPGGPGGPAMGIAPGAGQPVVIALGPGGLEGGASIGLPALGAPGSAMREDEEPSGAGGLGEMVARAVPQLALLAGLPGGPVGPGAGGAAGREQGVGVAPGGPVGLVLGPGTSGAGLGLPVLAMAAQPGLGAVGSLLPVGQNALEGLGTKSIPGAGGLYVGVAGSFDMPMGITSSDYDTDAQGIPNLLAELRRRTNVHVTVQQRLVKLTPEELSDTPILHLRGHRPFSFTPQEREVIRQYVARGGTILAEDSHGPFGECFRREMVLIFGKVPRDLPPDHEVYRAHYVLEDIPAGDMGERYPLQGIDVGGRLGVIFSRNDYGDCWEGTGGWVKPEAREPAFKMGTNIFVYITAKWQAARQPAPVPPTPGLGLR